MIKKVYFGEYSLDLRRASSRYLWAGYYPVDLEVFVSKTFALSLLLLQARWRIGSEIGMAGERRPVKRPSLFHDLLLWTLKQTLLLSMELINILGFWIFGW